MLLNRSDIAVAVGLMGDHQAAYPRRKSVKQKQHAKRGRQFLLSQMTGAQHFSAD